MPDAGFYQRLIDELDEGVIFLDHKRKITFWSLGAEKLTGFSAAEVMADGCVNHCMRFAGLEALKACDGSCNIHRALSTGETIFEDIYFQHKEGHRIPVTLRLVPHRSGAAGPVEGVVEILRDNSRNISLTTELEDLRRMALIDPLTELGNRRFVEMNIATHLEEVRRYNSGFGLLFIDIDDFKIVNDSYGHNAGDRILRMVGRTLHHNLRSFDLSARWGGEEFVALVLNVNSDQLKEIAEKIRQLVETSPMRYGASWINITISLGATLARADDVMTELIGRADTAMYKSKKDGKNRVTLM
jgi:diguanylate cyclase (GGDEF)-like protein/PAS domain S-box-containing protein